eukprot:Pompholyxophrys_punicea_v1_NODE_523_length_1771_cov_1.611305.p1 type:complete len:420 gc:universal NODE_523_length_1771_cov_1.611305:426-1685(+)
MTEMGIAKNVIIFGAAMSCMEKCCRADIAFQLMERMKIEGIAPNVHIYNSAISACARCNLWEKGYALFKEMDEVNLERDVDTYNAILDAVASQIPLGRMLFEEGVRKGFYARVSRLGDHRFELDLRFLSLGGGEIALGWWFEQCLAPYLQNPDKLKNVKSLSLVTGYGETRTRGCRQGDGGMRKRCRAMLRFMNIHELEQPHADRIHIEKDALIEEAHRNCGKINFDLDGYIRWKKTETSANVIPDVPQKIGPRFKPKVPGSGRPPFIRVEMENTSPEYRLENQTREATTTTTNRDDYHGQVPERPRDADVEVPAGHGECHENRDRSNWSRGYGGCDDRQSEGGYDFQAKRGTADNDQRFNHETIGSGDCDNARGDSRGLQGRYGDDQAEGYGRHGERHGAFPVRGWRRREIERRAQAQ